MFVSRYYQVFRVFAGMSAVFALIVVSIAHAASTALPLAHPNNPALDYFVYLPIISKPRPLLWIGMQLRWDAWGYGRGSEVWDALWHSQKSLDLMTDADTIRSNNYAYYSINPFNWPSYSWYAYYSITTLELKSSTLPADPSFKWGYYWILPARYNLINGQATIIDGQVFNVAGPFDGYTAFGKAVRYWQMTNRDRFLMVDDGSGWQGYADPGDIVLWYDEKTRLVLYFNEMRRWYWQGTRTADTTQWIENLVSTNAYDSAAIEATSKMWPLTSLGQLPPRHVPIPALPRD